MRLQDGAPSFRHSSPTVSHLLPMEVSRPNEAGLSSGPKLAMSPKSSSEDESPIPQRKLEAVLSYPFSASSPDLSPTSKGFGTSLPITSNGLQVEDMDLSGQMSPPSSPESLEKSRAHQPDHEDDGEGKMVSRESSIVRIARANAKEVNNNLVDHLTSPRLNGHTKVGFEFIQNEAEKGSNSRTVGAKLEHPPEPRESDKEAKEGNEVSRVESTTYVLNDKVSLTVDGPEQWLCVARLPQDFTDEEFLELVEPFGRVLQAHLIHSETTGKFKGYALVLFAKATSSIQARHVLEGQEVKGGHTLDCDWLKFGLVEKASLHSKCLFVDHLPPDYRDMGEFRKLFSVAVNPPYCQIAIKNGVIQKWGLVEFTSSDEAATTLEKMNGYDLQGHQVRVQYCIPGVHAINIYMSFINNPLDTAGDRKALLEETPSLKVYDQLESLAKHNPWFVQSLQNIMATTNLAPDPQGAFKCGPIRQGPVPSPPAGADPAQAALILMLASKVTSQGVNPKETAALMHSIVKQLEGGVSAGDILQNLANSSTHDSQSSRPVLLQTPGEDEPSNHPKALSSPPSDLKSIITNLVESAQSMIQACTQSGEPAQSHSTIPNGHITSRGEGPPKQANNPQLMEMLLKSFQARIKNGVYSPKGSIDKGNIAPRSANPHSGTPRQYSSSNYQHHHSPMHGQESCLSGSSRPNRIIHTAAPVSATSPMRQTSFAATTSVPSTAMRVSLGNSMTLPAQTAALFALPRAPMSTQHLHGAPQMTGLQYQPVMYPHTAMLQPHTATLQGLNTNPYAAAYLSAMHASQTGYYQAAAAAAAAAAFPQMTSGTPTLLSANGSAGGLTQSQLLWNQNAAQLAAAAAYPASWQTAHLNGPSPVPPPPPPPSVENAGQPSVLTSMSQQAYLYAAAATSKRKFEDQYSNDHHLALGKKMKYGPGTSPHGPMMTSVLPQQ